MAALQPEPKYFIITAGATGSGKTGLIFETAKQLGLELNDGNYAKILVDDLVETDPKYKTKIDEILIKIKEECGGGEGCEKTKLENPTPELLKEFNLAYSNTRHAKGCGLDIADPQVKSCDEKNDANLKDATNDRKHVIFEFTGSYIPTWLLNKNFIPDGYTIILSYTLVDIDKLIERNTSRAYSAVEEYKRLLCAREASSSVNEHETAEKTQPHTELCDRQASSAVNERETEEKTQELRAPRLPDISKENFTKVLNTIKTVLLDIYNLCIKSYSEETCGSRRIDRLLLFDNREKPMINIFDSSEGKALKPDEFSALIDPFFPVTPIVPAIPIVPATEASGGKSKKKRSKSKRRKASRKRTIRRGRRRNK